MRPGLIGVILSQGKKRESACDKPREYASPPCNEEKKTNAENPDAENRRQSGRNQAFPKQPLGEPYKQVEKRRVKVRTVSDRCPGTLEVGQTAKIDSKQLIEPKALLAGFKKNICEI